MIASPTRLSRHHRRRTDVSVRRGVAAVLLALALLFGPAAASAASSWWNADWPYRKAITINLPSSAGANMPAAVVVPIRLHAGNFEYFQDLQPNGADLRFISADGVPLKYQLEVLDPAASLLVAWVEVPVTIGRAEQSIWMYYGNAGAASADSSPYDSEQVLVLHFAESQGLPRDATASHYDAAASSAQLGAPGVIGNGARFDGSDSVRFAARPALALAPNGALTFAAWVQAEAGSQTAVLYSQMQNDQHVEIGIADSRPYVEIRSGQRTTRVESSTALGSGQWQQITAAIGTQIALYVDGTPAGSGPSGGLPAVNGDVLIGGPGDSRGVGGFKGTIDEVEISRSVRSPWSVRVNALAQSPETTLVAYGADQQKGSGGKLQAYFAMMRNLLGQVSIDGLLVIAITALMGLASFQVFLSKTAWVKRVEREDARFLDGFTDRFAREATAAAAGTIGAEDSEYAASGQYSMYRAGLHALADAAAALVGPRAALVVSSEAFVAIRAGLDGALVEATDRLNARLVVMTVAIAGAPFLGLLGTVMGVMITFASIAAAGDVNVNTIAPGVAAAMAATVVGLLVAIPSLFGYNWLATRISRRTSAMEVFADRFVARLGLLALAARAQSAVPQHDDASRRSSHAA